MKKFLGLFLALSIVITSFAVGSSVVLPVKNPGKLHASEVFIPIGKTGTTISLLDLSEIKIKEFEALTGQKMKLGEKLSFKLLQKQLRNSIDSDGTINNKKLVGAAGKADPKISKGLYIVLAIFGLGWLAMGILDDWSGSDWWICLLLYILFYLPGLIFALVKMKKYYS